MLRNNILKESKPLNLQDKSWKGYFENVLKQRQKEEGEIEILHEHISCLIDFSTLKNLEYTAYFLEKAQESLHTLDTN